MSTLENPRSEFRDLGRLISPVDGVFAVALTLLVLDLKLPSSSGGLALALLQMLPGFLVYLIAFGTIAGYWMIHHGCPGRKPHASSQLLSTAFSGLCAVSSRSQLALGCGFQPAQALNLD